MKFKDYILSLLPGFLRRPDGTKTDIERWAEALGVSLDDLKQAIFKVRRAWLIDTATGPALDLHGRDRGISRLPGESDESYRQRLKAAYQTYALGGTNPGLVAVLKVMGYPEARIHELFKDGVVTPLHNGQNSYNGAARHQGGVRWAEFKIFMGIEGGKDYAAAERQALLAAINKVKASHSKLAAITLELAMSDRLVFTEQQAITAAWQAEDGAAGPILLHTGAAPYGVKHDGKAFYQSGRLRDGTPALTAAVQVGPEIIPGCRTYRTAYKHDGGRPRFRHAGSLLRASFWQHNGQGQHNGAIRYREGVAHYGDKELLHGGLVRYGAGLQRDGSITHGANGLNEGLHLIVRRKGTPVEIDAA